MALFQLRKPRKEQAAPPPPTQTVEAVRRRALHRLIGAAVLVVAGVIGFPLIFDSQPRPIPVDLPIEIADKDKVPPLQVPSAAVPPTPAAAGRADTAPAATSVPEAEVPSAAADSAPTVRVQASAPTANAAPAAVRAQAASAAGGAATAAARSSDAAEAQKARALLEGRAPAVGAAPQVAAAASAPASEARFVVQVGAFADAQKLREVRTKVERAGFKTYTQVVTTKDGPRTRVRVGPFDDRSKAQQAADRIRQLDLAPSVLTL